MKRYYHIVNKGSRKSLAVLAEQDHTLTIMKNNGTMMHVQMIGEAIANGLAEQHVKMNEVRSDDRVKVYTLNEESPLDAGKGRTQSVQNSLYDEPIAVDHDDDTPYVFDEEEEKESDSLEDLYMPPITVSASAVSSSNPEKKEEKKKSSFVRKRQPQKLFIEPFEGEITEIIDIQEGRSEVIVEGLVTGVELREFPTVSIVSYSIVDKTNSINAKNFFKDLNEAYDFESRLKKAGKVRAKGGITFDSYDKDLVMETRGLFSLPKAEVRKEARHDSRVELHLHTKMSDKDALIDVKQLIGRIKDWGHPAVAITDHGVVQAFPEAQYISQEKGVKMIYGVEAYLIENEDSNKRYHIILLAQNEAGLRNLYKMITISHLQYYKRRPRLPREVIKEHREGIIIGSACEAGELMQAIIQGDSWEHIQEIAKFYDYLEIQPITNNRFLIRQGLASNDEDLREFNRKVVRLGEELNIPVVATCDAHFMDPEDKIYREMILACTGFTDADQQPDLYLRTTEEMLEEFAYLGEDKAYEVVVKNTRMINDQIESFQPIPDGTYAPKIDGADEALEEMCYKNAKAIYGDPLPDVVRERLEYELERIIGNGFGVLYYIAHKLVTKSLHDGYLVGSRGSVGSSFVATMAEITEVNPLPAHYVCPNCKHSEFFTDGSYAGGFDLPDKNCPECGTPLEVNGHDIPFAIFMGFNGDKVPDIDLNFSGDYQAKAHKFTEELFGRDNVFKAGTIGTIADKTAVGYAIKYMQDKGRSCRYSFYEAISKGMTKVKNTTGQHPGGIMVCPRDMDVHHFTPVQYPANKKESGIITTHFDYHSIEGRMTKLDILGHDDPTIIRILEDMTGLDAKDVPFNDEETLKLFYSTESIGLTPEQLHGDTVATLGIPEFGTNFVRKMLEDSKPKTFSELVRISGFSHGTNVWLDNAQTLIKNGTCKINEAISTRDDIMNYLRLRHIDDLIAFSIMENVRKGKGIEKRNKQGEATTNYIEILREGNIPEWFIESCLKISYLFPKAHAVAYVMMAFRIAWFKINHPLAFYASYFSIRAKAFDCAIMVPGLEAQEKEYKRIASMEKKARSNKDENMLSALEVSLEMAKRGFEFTQVDIWQSDAKLFKIVDGKLLPPFIAVDGLGETVAEAIVEERARNPFTSIADVSRRTKLSSTLSETMKELGIFKELPDEEQMNLFEL